MAAAFRRSNRSVLRVEINLVEICSGFLASRKRPIPSSCRLAALTASLRVLKGGPGTARHELPAIATSIGPAPPDSNRLQEQKTQKRPTVRIPFQ
jgi:hypothetical protein